MKRGFTLLELIVVIIIIGILATLGFTQFQTMIEKSRGAEARMVLGDIRKAAAAFRLQYGTLGATASHAAWADADAGIGAAAGDIPSACTTSHYFSYATAAAEPVITITATRCGAGAGKPPGSATYGALTMTLTSTLTTGVDLWGGTGPWD